MEKRYQEVVNIFFLLLKKTRFLKTKSKLPRNLLFLKKIIYVGSLNSCAFGFNLTVFEVPEEVDGPGIVGWGVGNADLPGENTNSVAFGSNLNSGGFAGGDDIGTGLFSTVGLELSESSKGSKWIFFSAA